MIDERRKKHRFENLITKALIEIYLWTLNDKNLDLFFKSLYMGLFCWIDDFFPCKMYVNKMSKWVYSHMDLISLLTNP